MSNFEVTNNQQSQNQNQPFSVVIPARYGSSRLAGKPLLDIAGKPMIQRVYEQAKASLAERVIVATDNEQIQLAVEAFGGEVCITSANHQSGTDRIEEVTQLYQFDDQHTVVNVQGDEPLIPPAAINQVAFNLQHQPNAEAATLCEPITDSATMLNPNAVKVVTRADGIALYFSRAPIPWHRGQVDLSRQEFSIPEGYPAFRHIGIYAYRVALLKRFVSWQSSQLEQGESLEQLRILEQGHALHVDVAKVEVPAGVDTQEDLEAVRRLF